MSRLEKIKPATRKMWLHVLSGIMWSGVGLYLCSLAFGWLQPEAMNKAILLSLSGGLLAIAIYLFGFSTFADKNIQRIRDLPGQKICIFAFQKWSSYPLVVVMISLGIFLRKFSPIPKPYLASLYLGIGGSLFLASFHYYKETWQVRL
jgi:hypothetical protein